MTHAEEINNNFKPIFLKGEDEAKSILDKNPSAVYVDAFSRQLKEFFIIENPIYAGERKEEGFQSKEFSEFCQLQEKNNIYVYYPWSGSVVKTLLKEAYFKLKTNRNQELINSEEQKKLSACKAAVLGMSVGSNVALVLTQAGISNSITIADFDELDTTNLNRIVAGVHQVGMNKCVIAARHIYEDNPFAEVTAWQDGANEENLKNALKNGSINIIIEEVDNLAVKIKTRELAREYKVPVIMVTDNGDGVMLHIERYDLGYDKIFNKPFEYWQNLFQKKPSMEEIGKVIVNDVLGGPANVSERVFASVERIMKHELISWAQLGSAALLGGVVATVALKDIVLGRSTEPYIEKNIQIKF